MALQKATAIAVLVVIVLAVLGMIVFPCAFAFLTSSKMIPSSGVINPAEPSSRPSWVS